MNEDLKESIEKYKDCTLLLIKALEKEDYDILKKILDERQKTIDHIAHIQYTKEQFKDLVEEFDVLMLQKKLTKLMNEKRNNLRNELNKISNSKLANKSYNSRLYQNAVFFNKKL